MTHADDDWVTLAAVRASIGDFLDQVGHEPLRVDVGHATLHVTRDGEQFAVDVFGSGGGWADTRHQSRRALVAYVEAQADVQLLRPESQRPEAEP